MMSKKPTPPKDESSVNAGAEKPKKVFGKPFQKGQSGNPAGLPAHVKDVRAAARTLTVEAIERLAFWMRSDNPKASVSATVAILNRGWGMPTQNINQTVRDLRQMTDAELYEFLTDESGSGAGAAEAPGSPRLAN